MTDSTRCPACGHIATPARPPGRLRARLGMPPARDRCTYLEKQGGIQIAGCSCADPWHTTHH